MHKDRSHLQFSPVTSATSATTQGSRQVMHHLRKGGIFLPCPLDYFLKSAAACTAATSPFLGHNNVPSDITLHTCASSAVAQSPGKK